MLGEDGATVFGVDVTPDPHRRRDPLVVRNSARLEPILVETVQGLQKEYDEWIRTERELRDKHAAAVDQVEIRERLLKEFSVLLEQTL